MNNQSLSSQSPNSRTISYVQKLCRKASYHFTLAGQRNIPARSRADEFATAQRHLVLAWGCWLSQFRTPAAAIESAQQLGLFGTAEPAPRQRGQQQQLGLFTDNQVAIFGARANPQQSVKTTSGSLRLELQVQDPRTSSQRAADQLRREEELTTPMF